MTAGGAVREERVAETAFVDEQPIYSASADEVVTRDDGIRLEREIK